MKIGNPFQTKQGNRPMDCSPPGPSIHGIFQAKVLEWGAIAPVQFLGPEDLLEKGYATHFSVLGLPWWLSW